MMAVYNREKFVDDAINSVVSQTYGNWELIVVDDHSTDGAVARIKDWMSKDSRIKAIFNSENEGIPATRNRGIRMASGKYIIFLDSDDVFRNNALQRMVDELDQQPDYGVVVAEFAVIDEQGKLTGETSLERYGRPKLQAGLFFDELITRSFIICAMFRRELVQKFGIWRDETLKGADDWLFWLDLSAVTQFKYLQEPLLCYRVHSSNVSITAKDTYAHDFMLIPDVIFSRYAKRLTSKQRKALLETAAYYCERSSLETAKKRTVFYRSIITDIQKLESENAILQSELKTIKSELKAIKSGFMYRCVKSTSSKIDSVFPEGSLRGKFRKWITYHLQ
jgi:glycosyltransferase involved in cell wall biosynthesis